MAIKPELSGARRAELENLLAPLFRCSVSERFELMKSLGISERELDHMNLEGAPIVSAGKAIDLHVSWEGITAVNELGAKIVELKEKVNPK